MAAAGQRTGPSDRLRRSITATAAILLVTAAVVAQQLEPEPSRTPQPDLVLSGTLTAEDHQSWREVPFVVPEATQAISVRFEHTGRDRRATIDLGLRDPERLRGWSGGNKAHFTVAESWATPSYLPGPLPAGRWSLILGVPNLRQGTEARWRAEIVLHDQAPPAATGALRSGSRWYRGDLHLHTGHSDGTCRAQSGERVPCPVHRTLDAALERGLDFVALTEHNTPSHFATIAELQPAYDRLLILPGQEITTFEGHLNVIGVPVGLPFQLGTERLPDIETLLDLAEVLGAFVTVNHPRLPSGEACMGCGWSAAGVDLSRLDAVEVLNGGAMRSRGSVEGPFLGVPFWERALLDGQDLTAIGASDNHDPDLPFSDFSAVGRPATVVHAEELSVVAILEGLREGRAFVDASGRVEVLDFVVATPDGSSASMGGELEITDGTPLEIQVTTQGAAGLVPVARESTGGTRRSQPLADSALHAIRLPTLAGRFSEGRDHGWVRLELRDSEGKLVALGNAVRLRRRP